VLDFNLAGGVLEDGKCVDHANGIVVAKALQLCLDLTMKVGMIEPQDNELHWPDGHDRLLSPIAFARLVAHEVRAIARFG
jgi:hypothetical protein